MGEKWETILGSDHFCSVAKPSLNFVTPWTAACQASLSFTMYQNLLKFIASESVMPFNHLILGRPCLLLTTSGERQDH